MSSVHLIVLVVMGETIAAAGLFLREHLPDAWSQPVADVGMAIGGLFAVVVSLSIIQNGTHP